MNAKFKAGYVSIDQLMLAFFSQAKALAEVPEQLPVDHMMAHLPVGSYGPDQMFHVTSNFRVLVLRSYLPPKNKVPVMVDKDSEGSDLKLLSAQRDLLNCIVSTLKSRECYRTLAALCH